MDKDAIKILFDTYWSTSGWKSDPQTSLDNFEYAKIKGVMFDALVIDHNATNKWLIDTFDKTSKEHIVKCFLSSLTTKRLDLRSGLSSYTFARHFPNHAFSSHNYKFCTICGQYNAAPQKEDLNVLNFERIKWGGVRLSDPIYVAFNLEQLNRENFHNPTAEDIKIFHEIISVIKNCESTDRPSQLEKKLATVLKSNKQERKVLINIFGICGILETNLHKGYFENYIPKSKQYIRPVNKTDWLYPVDWWTGADGINESALEFFFAEYL